MKLQSFPRIISILRWLLVLVWLPANCLMAQIVHPPQSKDTLSKEQQKANLFYHNLQQRAWKNRFLTEIHRLIFISPDTSHPVKTPEQSHIRFLKFQGKYIRTITFVGLDVFGPSVNDTTRIPLTWAANMVNKMHVYTRTSVLRKLLLQHEGDMVNPYLLADNEHVIRNLPFVKDAKFILLPDPSDPNFVDVVILTQDVYALGLVFQPLNISSTKFGIYDINLWGLGHRQSNMFLVDPLQKQGVRYVEGSYRIENIDKLFMSGELHYTNYIDNQSLGAELSRKFFTFDRRLAGGISFYHYKETIRENDYVLMNSRYNQFSSWIGYAIPFSFSENTKNALHNRLVATLSLDKTQYTFRQVLIPTSYLRPYNNTLVITGLSLSSNAFYRDNLLFGYGISEDIPYGKLFGVQLGYSYEETHNRTYLDLLYASGYKISNLGYINYSVESGGFFHSGTYEDGIFKSKLSLASALYTKGAHHFRHYINLTYVRGINLLSPERIVINDKYGIRGLKSQTLVGTQKLSMNLESVMFSPLYVLGFRFSTFGFFDFGFIGSEGRSIFDQQMYSGLGLGIRIKNENLLFNTFQLRFALYPLEPDRTNRFSIDVSDVPSAAFPDFTVKKPQVISFE